MIAYTIYQDDGPSGPCGQSMNITRKHHNVLIFVGVREARAFIGRYLPKMLRFRIKARFSEPQWSDSVDYKLGPDCPICDEPDVSQGGKCCACGTHKPENFGGPE